MQTEHKLQSRKGTGLSQNIPQKNVNDHLFDIYFHKSIPFFSVACSRRSDSRRPEQAIFSGTSSKNNRNLELFIRPRDLTHQISIRDRTSTTRRLYLFECSLTLLANVHVTEQQKSPFNVQLCTINQYMQGSLQIYLKLVVLHVCLFHAECPKSVNSVEL